MSRRLEQGTDLWQSLSDIWGVIHVLYPQNIDKLSQWQSHNLGPQVSKRDPLGVAWFIDTEINNTSAINFLGASNTNGHVWQQGWTSSVFQELTDIWPDLIFVPKVAIA